MRKSCQELVIIQIFSSHSNYVSYLVIINNQCEIYNYLSTIRFLHLNFGIYFQI